MARANHLYQAVREVLFREWDPIGVNTNPLVADEYDSYAPAICRMLAARADEFKEAAHLGRLRTDAMGLPDGKEQRGQDRRVASRVRGLVGRGTEGEPHA
jgi:hypothetical protein